MTRRAKAMSAFINGRSGSAAGRDARSSATRGASLGVKGSGAPAGRVRLTVLGLIVALSVMALAAALAPAAKKVDSFAGSTTGATGSTAGLLNTPRGIAVNQNGTGGAQAGDFYVVDSSNNRISQYRSNNTFVRSFGQDVVSSGPDQAVEVQWVTVNATEGAFRLTFNAQNTGATGTGDVTESSATIQNVSTSTGTFTVGKAISGIGIPAGTTIAGVGAGTITLSQPATATNAAVALSADLPFNASATAVQGALNALSTISAGGGSVAVSGGPGDGTGSSPYVVSFNGGPLKGTNVAQMTAANGFAALAGGSGFGANLATVTTANSGATGYEICDALANPTDVCKAGTTGGLGGAMSAPQGIAIDQTTGNLDVTDSSNRRIQRFSATGAWQRAFGWDTITNGAATSDAANVVTFQTCTTMQNCKVGVGGTNGGQMSSSGVAGHLATDSAGNLYFADSGNRRIQKFDNTGAFVSAWGWDVIPATKPGDTGTALEVCPATAANTSGDCQAGTQGANAGQFGLSSPTRIAVDSTAKLYAVDSGNNRVQSFNSSGASPEVFAAAEHTAAPSPTEIAVGSSNRVFVGRACSATLCPGAAASNEFRIREYTSAGVLQDTHMADAGFSTVNGLAVNPTSGNLYVSTSGGTPGSRVWTLDDSGAVAPTIAIDPVSSITEHTASFSGTITPNGPTGIAASYRFEYSRDGVDWTRLPTTDVNLGDGSSPIVVSQNVTGLEANTFYRVRIVVTKTFGSGVYGSAELNFLTDSVGPEVQTFNPIRIEDTTAILRGQVNPNNLATTYHFEYGETTAYGSKAPVPDGNLSGGTDKQIYADIEGLKPDTLYHIRLAATNFEGTTNGADVEFRTYPTYASEPDRSWEMMTPPFKALPSGFAGGGHAFISPNPGVPSLDGEAMLWANAHFPLSDDVDSVNSGDVRIMRRTADGWTFETRNTLPIHTECLVCAPGETVAPTFGRIYGSASSGDMETTTSMLGSGGIVELLPSEGPIPNRMYTRRDGTGVEGWTGWLTNPLHQFGGDLRVPQPTSGSGFGDGGNSADSVRLNDDGSAMVRWWYYRDLADDPETPVDEDPSYEQQAAEPNGGFPASVGGRSIYLQRASDPLEMPSAPRELVNGCTGTNNTDATQLPARIGTGVATDTIGSFACKAFDGAKAAAGTVTRKSGSATLTNVTADSGVFAVGQILQGKGILPGTQITAVGLNTLTISQNGACGGPQGSGIVASGSSAVITGVTLTPSPCGSDPFSIGQTLTVTPSIFGSPSTHTITAVDTDAQTLTVTPPTSCSLFCGSSTLAVQSSTDPISAEAQAVTSIRGAELGGGGLEQGSGGTSQGALSEDGSRVIFQSPDTSGPGASVPVTGCTAVTGAATVCVPQLFLRAYNSSNEPTVRWISRSQGVGPQQVAQLGRGAFFEGASRDARHIYFRTNSPLLSSDPNGGGPITTGAASDNSFDLYRYELPDDPDSDPADGSLMRVSGGPMGTADPSTNNSVTIDSFNPPGSGAALRYLSDNGELAYFVTTSPLTGADEVGPRGGATVPGGTVGNGTRNSGIRNLYLFDDSGTSPQWHFIARLPFSISVNESFDSESAAVLNACASFAKASSALGGSFVAHLRQQFQPARGNCFRGTADGKHVLFQTAGRLTKDDVDNASDIYFYDYTRDELTRITAPPPGANSYECNSNRNRGFLADEEFVDGFCNGDLGVNLSGSGATLGSSGSAAGENARGWGGGRYYNLATNLDGTVSVFFNSKTNLVPEDVDLLGRSDVYQWREGKLTLMTPEFPEMPYWYSGSSLDGEDVFVDTMARLDPREIADFDMDLYDLRVGGGFSYTPPPVPCNVLAHECRSTALNSAVSRVPATTTFTGAGNVAQKAKRRCGKGKVQRANKCIERKPKVKRTKKRRRAEMTGRTSR